MGPDSNMTLSGIYAIVNMVDQSKFYVGSTTNLARREREHLSELRRGDHHNHHLQRAWNRLGASGFEFYPLLVCPQADLLQLEQLLLGRSRTHYNLALSATAPMTGRRHSETTRALLSKAKMGHPVSDEARAKISSGNRGRQPGLATRLLMSAARKGVPKTPEHRARISSAKLGRPFSPQHRANVVAANKLRTGSLASPETRAKLSAFQKARWERIRYARG